MWFGSDLEKSDSCGFFLFRLNKIKLIQSEYAKNPIWAGSLNKALTVDVILV